MDCEALMREKPDSPSATGPTSRGRNDLSLPLVTGGPRIVEIGAGALQGLMTDLSSSNPRTRAAALESFQRLANGDAMPILLKALYHPLADVQAQAVAALKAIGTPEALAALRAWEADRRGRAGERQH